MSASAGRRLAVETCALLALAVLLLARAAGAGAFTWAPLQHVDRSFFGATVSCGPEGFCAAVSQEGSASFYDGGSWSTPETIDPSEEAGGVPTESPKEALTSLSCAGGGFCMAAGALSALSYSAGSWSKPTEIAPAKALVRSLSCTASSFCMAVTLPTRRKPPDPETAEYLTYDGSSWSSGTPIPGVLGLSSLSCAEERFCMALDANGDAWLYDGGSWAETATPAEGLASVSCPSRGFCVGGGARGVLRVFAAPAWSGAVKLAEGAAIAHVWCVSSSFCMAISAQGQAFELSDGSWNELALGAPVSSLSCSSASSCQAVGPQGRAWSFDGSAWSQVESVGRGRTALSCAPGTRFCLMTDENGAARRYTSGVWEETLIAGPEPFGALDCASEAFCASVGDGEAATFNGTSWASPSPFAGASGERFSSVSCPSARFCAAVSPNDVATFDGREWSVAAKDAGAQLVSVSCSSEGFCAALGAKGATLVYSAGAWKSSKSLTGASSELASFDAISCAGDDFCAALLEQATKSASYLYDGRSWRKVALPELAERYGPWRSISCASSSFCEAANVEGLTDVYNGSRWAPGGETGLWVEGIACASSSFCLAKGHEGAVASGS